MGRRERPEREGRCRRSDVWQNSNALSLPAGGWRAIRRMTGSKKDILPLSRLGSTRPQMAGGSRVQRRARASGTGPDPRLGICCYALGICARGEHWSAVSADFRDL